MSPTRLLQLTGIAALICTIAGLALLGLLPPPNPLWALSSGYYQYDPRVASPPPALLRDRPEESLRYFLDATLAACGRIYPPALGHRVTHYQIERVEYFGKTDYHAFSNIHTRLYFADGASVLAIFRLEAGHNEHSLLFSLGETSTIGAGSWMAIGGLVRSPHAPPPGWAQYQENQRPYHCPPSAQPNLMQDWQPAISAP